MHIFLRRNGKVIGAFDRDDYLSLRDQGGVFSGDEWCHVGGDFWCLVGANEPFLRRSEEKRQKAARTERMISDAMRDSYNFKVWYSRVSYRAGLHDASIQPDASALVGRSFLSSVTLGGFGAFSEDINADFSLINPHVFWHSPLCCEWLCPGGLGKTSLGRAVEMVRNVSRGKKLRKEDLSYLHGNQCCRVILDFQFRDGIDSANLSVWNGVPSLSASPRVCEALKRIRFIDEADLDPLQVRNYLAPENFEIIRAGWLCVFPRFPVTDEGVCDESVLRCNLANPRGSERILAELLLLLHEAEAGELTLIFAKPLACLNVEEAKHALRCLSDASLRGANQVLLLGDAR